MQSTAWEDLHVGANGRNYGWPLCEGPCDNEDYEQTCSCGLHDDPLHTYPHNNQGASIIGGGVYRGNMLPQNPYFGAYFYGDFTRRWLRYLTFDQNGAVESDVEFSSFVGRIFHLGYSNAGAIYYTTDEGEMHRIIFDDGDRAPVITSLSAITGTGSTALQGPVPLTVNFAVSAEDAEGDVVSYRWLFGDGTEATGATASKTYTQTGTYLASVLASDGDQATQSALLVVEAGVPPTVSISSPVNGASFRAGDVINLAGAGSDPFETLSDSSFRWTVRFRHDDHYHPVIEDVTGPNAQFEVPSTGHDFSGNVAFDITLEVSDAEGLTSKASVEIMPEKHNLVFNTLPVSISTNLDGIPRPPPFLHDTLVGFVHSIEVPDVICAADKRYAFQSWSDGGSVEHDIVVPDGDTLILATFIESDQPCQSLEVREGMYARWQADFNVATDNGASVVAWVDRTGLEMTSLNADSPAHKLPNALNGRSVIRVSGSGGLVADIGLFAPGSSSRTVVMLIKYDAGETVGGVAFGDSFPGACGTTYQLAKQRGGLGVSINCNETLSSSAFASVAGYWLLYTLTVDDSGGLSFFFGCSSFSRLMFHCCLAPCHGSSCPPFPRAMYRQAS